MSGDQVGAIVTAAITALPSILSIIRESHAQANPDASPLTDAQAKAALRDAVVLSLARDAELRTASASDLGHYTGSTGE